MNRKQNLIILFFLAVIAVLFWWWFGKPKQQTYPQTSSAPQMAPPSSVPTAVQHTPQTAQALAEKRKGAIAQVQGIFGTPIEFYGRVIDQNGDPVPDANVAFGVIDKFYASGSDYKGKSDANGNFSISGIKGAVLTVAVVKDGYHYIHGKSNGSFGYGMGPDSTRKEPPTKENPAVFVLHKMGATEPLIQIDPGGIRIAKNGAPIEIDLSTGHRLQNSKRILRVEAWTENEGLSSNQPYNWRCRVSIPGGGLIERTEQFNFQAPKTGYRQFDEVRFQKDDPSWQSRFDKDYFAQLPDGTYARFKFGFRSGGDHFFRIESYLNPKPGSRNLEFDPQKVAP